MKPPPNEALAAYHQIRAFASLRNDPAMDLEQAKAAVNWIAAYAEDHPDTARELCQHAQLLAAARDDPALDEQHAKAITNWIADCAPSRPEEARRLYECLRDLAADRPDRNDLTVQRAKAAGNLAFAARETRDLSLGTYAFRELSLIVDDHADDPEIKAVVEHVSRMFDVDVGRARDG